MHLRKIRELRTHQPTPIALSSDQVGSSFCMAGNIFSNSSSATEWNAHAKWPVERPEEMLKIILINSANIKQWLSEMYLYVQ